MVFLSFFSAAAITTSAASSSSFSIVTMLAIYYMRFIEGKLYQFEKIDPKGLFTNLGPYSISEVKKIASFTSFRDQLYHDGELEHQQQEQENKEEIRYELTDKMIDINYGEIVMFLERAPVLWKEVHLLKHRQAPKIVIQEFDIFLFRDKLIAPTFNGFISNHLKLVNNDK